MELYLLVMFRSASFLFEGAEATSPAILGKENDEALLGVVTLENFGLVLNPLERTLQPMHTRA